MKGMVYLLHVNCFLFDESLVEVAQMGTEDGDTPTLEAIKQQPA